MKLFYQSPLTGTFFVPVGPREGGDHGSVSCLEGAKWALTLSFCCQLVNVAGVGQMQGVLVNEAVCLLFEQTGRKNYCLSVESSLCLQGKRKNVFSG